MLNEVIARMTSFNFLTTTQLRGFRGRQEMSLTLYCLNYYFVDFLEIT